MIFSVYLRFKNGGENNGVLNTRYHKLVKSAHTFKRDCYQRIFVSFITQHKCTKFWCYYTLCCCFCCLVGHSVDEK